jgi:hypothetical protein
MTGALLTIASGHKGVTWFFTKRARIRVVCDMRLKFYKDALTEQFKVTYSLLRKNVPQFDVHLIDIFSFRI